MKTTSFATALLAAGAAVAAPVDKRAAITDADILNFALTLEHLEDAFYKEGLSKYSQSDFQAMGAVPRFRFNLNEVSYDESTHVSFLTSALQAAGATPVAACSYNFGLTDVNSFVQLARTLEGVGVSAYLGAAQFISNPDYLTAAGSILTVEARHNAYIRDNQKPPQTPFPYPFDVPLDINQVYTLASQFITSCPSSNPALPAKAFPVLSAGPLTLNPARAGQDVYLRTTNYKIPTNKPVYCAWPNVAGPSFTAAKIDLDGTRAICKVPDGQAGQAYPLLSTSNSAISDANTLAGPAIVAVQAPYTYPGFPMSY